MALELVVAFGVSRTGLGELALDFGQTLLALLEVALRGGAVLGELVLRGTGGCLALGELVLRGTSGCLVLGELVLRRGSSCALLGELALRAGGLGLELGGTPIEVREALLAVGERRLELARGVGRGALASFVRCDGAAQALELGGGLLEALLRVAERLPQLLALGDGVRRFAGVALGVIAKL